MSRVAPLAASILVSLLIAAGVGETVLRVFSKPGAQGDLFRGSILLPKDWDALRAHMSSVWKNRSRDLSFLVYDPQTGWAVGPNRQSSDGRYRSGPEGLRTSEVGESYAQVARKIRAGDFAPGSWFTAEPGSGDWGTWDRKAKPSRRGLTLMDVDASEGGNTAPDNVGDMRRPRGAGYDPTQVSRRAYDLNDKFEVWSDNVSTLYEEAVARQWSATRDIAEIAALYRELAPDLVHHVALKPVVYGSIAASLARTPRVVNALTGLGFAFGSQGARARATGHVARHVLRRALDRRGRIVVVQNRRDADPPVT